MQWIDFSTAHYHHTAKASIVMSTMHALSLFVSLVLFALISFASPVICQTPSLYIISSVAATTQRLSVGQPIPANATRQPNLPLLTFNPSQTYQRIHGFGGAMTEASAVNMQLVGAASAASIMAAYYDPYNGNMYTVTRVPMNSCDFTRSSYNFDNVTDDFDLTHFDTTVKHDADTMIPFLQQAKAISHHRLNMFLTPWSPPGWMKGNGQMDKSSIPCLLADRRYHQSWANYFVKFLNAYETYNLTFWGLTPQNEPLNSGAGPWECCFYNSTDLRDFIRDYLGPTVHKAYPNINIMNYDHNKDAVLEYADAVFADKAAAAHVWGTAFHWYSGLEFDQLELVHQHWPNKNMLATEACNCGGVHLDDWSRGELYAVDITGDLNAWAMGWVDWNLVLNNQGGPNHLGNFCDAPVIIRFDIQPVTVHYQPNYYILGHFSRFLPPGAIRINTTITGTTPLIVTTFRVDLDTRDVTHSQVRRLVGADTGSYLVSVITNTNDADTNIQFAVGKGFATVLVPQHSIHTIAFSLDVMNENQIIDAIPITMASA